VRNDGGGPAIESSCSKCQVTCVHAVATAAVPRAGSWPRRKAPGCGWAAVRSLMTRTRSGSCCGSCPRPPPVAPEAAALVGRSTGAHARSHA
jgi:hypothetical protein